MLKRILVACVILSLASPAQAILRIEITRGVAGAQPIAVVPFEWQGEGEPPIDIAGIVSADLARSGRFKPHPEGEMIATPSRGEDVNFKDWRVLGVDNLVIGRLARTGDGYKIRFQLFDVYGGRQLLGYEIPAGKGALRDAAHQVSDMIYEELTGQRGAFSTRVAYVTVVEDGDRKRYSLVVADADGANPVRIMTSSHPIMSPSWSPDGERLAYVSFENKRAEVFIQDLATGKRQSISGRAGINNAPVFSPDGSRLALTLSTEPGNPDVYVKDIESGALNRITRSPAIDTEPAWAPDGSSLYFTSDRGGGPQVYRVVPGERPKRVTFEGGYNASPTVSPDGKHLAMVHRDRGKFRIAVMNLETEALRVLTEGALDESPSFAPNGSMIIYATQHGNEGVLAAVSVDGRVHQRLASRDALVREPVWSPYTREWR